MIFFSSETEKKTKKECEPGSRIVLVFLKRIGTFFSLFQQDVDWFDMFPVRIVAWRRQFNNDYTQCLLKCGEHQILITFANWAIIMIGIGNNWIEGQIDQAEEINNYWKKLDEKKNQDVIKSFPISIFRNITKFPQGESCTKEVKKIYGNDSDIWIRSSFLINHGKSI